MQSASPPAAPPPAASPRGVGLAELFTGFPSLGLMSFGGALPFARRTIVEERKRLSADEFTDLLGLCQFLPGGNVINLSVAVGMRFRGVAGAFAGIPADRGDARRRRARRAVREDAERSARAAPVRGAAAAAAGLLVAMAVKVLKPLRHARAAAGIAVLAFVAIAVLRIPLLTTMLVLTPVSVVRVAPPRRGHAAAGAGRGARRAARRPAMNDTLIAIATIFSQLSLLAFGGGNTILPEMQRQVVDVHHWMSAHEFTALFALARRARAEHDDRVAGGLARGRLERALVASLAKFGPSSIVTVLALHAWERFRDRPLAPLRAAGDDAGHRRGRRGQRGADLRGIEPHRDPVGITAACAVLAWRTRIHPLWLLAGGALIGAHGHRAMTGAL